MENTLINEMDVKIFSEEIDSSQVLNTTYTKKCAILDLLAFKLHSTLDSNNFAKRVLYLNEICSPDVLKWLNQENFGFFLTLEEDNAVLYAQESQYRPEYKPYAKINNNVIRHFNKDYKTLHSLDIYIQSSNYFFKNTLIKKINSMTLSYINNELKDYLMYELFVEKSLYAKEKPLSLKDKKFLLQACEGNGMDLNNYIIQKSKDYIFKNINLITDNILESSNQIENSSLTDNSTLLKLIKNTINNIILTYLNKPLSANNLTILHLFRMENDFNIHSTICDKINTYEKSIWNIINRITEDLKTSYNIKISFNDVIENKRKVRNVRCCDIGSIYAVIIKGPIINYDVSVINIVTPNMDRIMINGFKDAIIMNTLKIEESDTYIYSDCKKIINNINNQIDEIKNLGLEMQIYE